MAAHLTRNKLLFGYPKSRQQHDAIIDKLEEADDETPIKPSLKVLLFRGIVMIIYLLLGGLAFRALEQNKGYKGTLDQKLIAERQILSREFNISEYRLIQYERLVRRRKSMPDSKDWDYYQSLYFASTVTTTIGYGHITPQTQSGRIFLIVFALIGIPLNILALASVGEHITVAIFHFLRYLSTHCFHNSRINHINIKVMLVSVFLMVCMLFIGGFLYCSTEEWTYIDSIYYCFVAMATIGFGDLVPNKGRAPDSDREKAIWFLRALYLSIGLSLVSTVFTALSNAMEEINFLLGRNKYTDWTEKSDQTKKKMKFPKKRKESKGGESEKISYKHKIKKHGSTVLKYKFLQKLKRKKGDGYIHADWDSLLAEAKRKQSETISQSANPDILKKPTILTLTNQKPTILTLTNQKGSLETYQKTSIVALPITPDDGDTVSTCVTECDTSSTLSNIFHPNKRDEGASCARLQQHVHRIHSTPIMPFNKRDFTALHSSVLRTSSQPVTYSMPVHKETLVDNRQNNFLGTQNDIQCRTYFDRGSPQWFQEYSHSCGGNFDDQRAYLLQAHSPQEYDIMVNQC